MITSRGGPGSGNGAPSSAAVLADRIAAALIHHEPGWRLPRLTALARRYNVSTAEVDVAIGELAARHLLRRLPDGQVYRASPAEYQVPLAGLAWLSPHVDPMGGELTCRSQQSSTRRVPEDTGRALGLAPGAEVMVVRSQWLVGGEPGALALTYLPRGQQGPVTGPLAAGGPAAVPRAVQLELGPPPPSVARSLRLTAGQSVATVTVRFEEPAAGTPVALTIAMLRPDLFRIVVQAPGGGESAAPPHDLQTAWTQPAEGWEP